jgi:SAM-dependent methyltransferase
MDQPEQLSALYTNRFDAADLAAKRALWQTLCKHFFDRYIRDTDTVLDLGAGSCEFINNTRGAEKIAVDLNPDTKHHAQGARVVLASSDDMSAVESSTVDVVFTSNFFEHLPDKPSLMRTLAECRRVLKPGGKLLILMPNLRYLAGRYWDYFDHHLPLTHLSLQEALNLAGFACDKVVPRFLPYTVKNSKLPPSPTLVRAYLRLRPAWPLLGRQMFLAAHSTRTEDQPPAG